MAIWTGKSDIDHIELVGRCLLPSDAFEQSSAKAYDLLPSSTSDKVFAVVVATRKADLPIGDDDMGEYLSTMLG